MSAPSHACQHIRFVWPQGLPLNSCVIELYQNGFELGKSLHAVERDRRDRYQRCLRNLLSDIAATAKGCDFNFVRGLNDGLHSLAFIEDMPDG